MKHAAETGLEIAVIGMAGVFPGAKNIDAFWENLKNGVESVSFFTHEELIDQGLPEEIVNNPNYVKAKPFLEGVEYFDADFFGYTTREAGVLDIQMRLFHQIIYHALEHAAYCPETYKGLIGLYAGASTDINWYGYLLSLGRKGSLETFESSTLANKDLLSQLISYKLNLKGPAQTIYTTCSTSLTAIHTASRALLLGECNIAVAGGVTINLPRKSGYLFEEGMICSKDGHCRAFDNDANGTIFGDGAGAVVLKRYRDAVMDGDTIYAIIKSSFCNNDGRRKVGLSAPSVEGQAEVIKSAYELGKIDPSTISYVEAHATGTNIGDPIEAAALKKVFPSKRKIECALGSVKANVGHLHAAAGVASFIKTVLSIYHKTLTPQINCTIVNKKMDFDSSPFYINTTLKSWDNVPLPLRAGVSSFGIGGTNTHLVLEEAPVNAKLPEKNNREFYVLTLSAKNKDALTDLTDSYSKFFALNQAVDLSDVCFTIHEGRKEMAYRKAFVVESISEYANVINGNLANRCFSLEEETTKKTTTLLLNLDEGCDLISIYNLLQNSAVLKTTVEDCLKIAEKLVGRDIKNLFLNKSKDFPAECISSFIIEYCSSQMWLQAGLMPDFVAGFGKSQYTAAVLAGTLSFETALELIYHMAISLDKTAKMAQLEVNLATNELKPYLNASLHISRIEYGNNITVTGDRTSIDQLNAALRERGISTQLLEDTYPLHTALLQDVTTSIPKAFEINPQKNQVSLLSSVNGEEISSEELTDPGYWLTVLYKPEHQENTIRNIVQKKNNILVYLDPCLNANKLPKESEWKKATQTHSLLPATDENLNLFIDQTLAKLWVNGAQINWRKVHHEGRRISLPLYPFSKTKIWPFHLNWMNKNKPSGETECAIDIANRFVSRPALSTDYSHPQNETEAIIVEILEELFGVHPIGTLDDLFELGGHSLLITQVVSKIKEIYQIDLALAAVFMTPNVKQVAAFLSDELGGIDKLEEISFAYREYQSMV